ncbi:MAG: DNA cytosine methyltransferase [Parasporobacterium sp.]|nr:DNA cytosine methyltransferase [Parasporobacterium sp.]
MKHYGDITKISGHDLPIVDCIVGGSPCQDLSVAGLRAGLEGERSGLFMEQIRIIKEMRENDRNNGRTGYLIRPRFAVWENVPGALSSGKPKGADFQAILTEFVKIIEPEAPDVPVPEKGWPYAGCLYDEMGRWSIAWRIHDAQFWGVPQRRKRIALVADFGGLCAPEVLFERKGLHWYPSESGEARETTAPGTERSVRAADCLNGWDVQSKHIQSADGIAESLYAGECRYGGGESYVCTE